MNSWRTLVLTAAMALSFTALPGFAADNVFCWKGYNQQDQNNNLNSCNQQKKPGQKCETNMWNDGQGAYDVCLQGSAHALTAVFCFSGYNQDDQNKNLATCQAQINSEQTCETNPWVTGHGAYDVCIMQ